MQNTLKCFYSSHMRANWRPLTAGVLGAVIAAGLLLTFPWLVRYAVDIAIPNRRYNLLFLVALVALLIQGLYLLLSLYIRKINFSVSMALTRQMRKAAIEKLYRLSDRSYSFLDNASFHAKLIIDIQRVDQMTSALFGILLPSIVTGGLIVAGMVVVSWKLTVVAFLVFGSFIPITRWFAARYGDIARRYQRCVREYSVKVEFSIVNFILTKLKSAENRDIETHQSVIDRLAESSEKLALWRCLFMEMQNLFAFATAVSLLGVVIAASFAGWLTLGDVMAFYIFAMLFRGQYVIFSQGLPPLLEGRHSLATIQEVMSLEESAVHMGGKPAALRESIRLRNVYFGYDNKVLLRGVDLSLHHAECIGLLGANGSGKTTIVKLLLGLLEPQSGEVLIDGMPIAEVDRVSFRRQIGVALQEPMIFGGTIAENICYGEDCVDRRKMEQAAKTVGLDGFVGSLVNGYDSHLGERGIMISGGQRQKISLARAVYGQPKFLIIDEPTNHLDQRSIEHILTSLAELPQRPGILIISNEKTILAGLEKLYRLDLGTLKRFGCSPVRVSEGSASGL